MVMLLEHLLHLLFRHTGNRFFSSRNHGLSKCQWKFEQKKTSGETPGSWILVNSPFTDKVMFSHNYAAYIRPLQKLQGPFRRKTLQKPTNMPMIQDIISPMLYYVNQKVISSY